MARKDNLSPDILVVATLSIILGMIMVPTVLAVVDSSSTETLGYSEIVNASSDWNQFESLIGFEVDGDRIVMNDTATEASYRSQFFGPEEGGEEIDYREASVEVLYRFADSFTSFVLDDWEDGDEDEYACVGGGVCVATQLQVNNGSWAGRISTSIQGTGTSLFTENLKISSEDDLIKQEAWILMTNGLNTTTVGIHSNNTTSTNNYILSSRFTPDGGSGGEFRLYNRTHECAVSNPGINNDQWYPVEIWYNVVEDTINATIGNSSLSCENDYGGYPNLYFAIHQSSVDGSASTTYIDDNSLDIPDTGPSANQDATGNGTFRIRAGESDGFVNAVDQIEHDLQNGTNTVDLSSLQDTSHYQVDLEVSREDLSDSRQILEYRVEGEEEGVPLNGFVILQVVGVLVSIAIVALVAREMKLVRAT